MTVYDALKDKYGGTMRTKHVADYLGCHVTTVREMCINGKLPAIRVGSRWVVPTVKMAEWLEGDANGK